MTTPRALLSILLTLILCVGCSSSPDAGRSGGGSSRDANSRGTGGRSGGDPGVKPVDLNSGDARERERLLFELDQRLGDWHQLQAEGMTGSRLNVERVIAGLVDGNFDELERLAGSDETDDRRGRLISAKSIGFAPAGKMKRDETEAERERRENRRARAGAALAKLLASGDATLVEYALWGFYIRREAGDPIDLVASHLGAGSPEIRRNAALAIYQMARKGARFSDAAAPVARARLLAQAHDREDANVRAAAAAAIGQVGSTDEPAFQDTLINMLGDDELRPRLRAIVALATIGGRAALEPLCSQLEHELSNIRHHAALALAVITNRLGYGFDASMLEEDAEAWRKAIRARQER